MIDYFFKGKSNWVDVLKPPARADMLSVRTSPTQEQM
jgi:hypothetical protein